MTKRILLVAALAVAMVVIVSGLALAAGQGTVIPHGGYDMNTDACLQCHDIHESAGDYVLTRWSTVTATCGSCHFLYRGSAPTSYPNATGGSPGYGAFATNAFPNVPLAGIEPAYRPGYSGDDTRAVSPAITSADNSVGSRISAYEVDGGDILTAPGHQLSRGPGLHDYGPYSLQTADFIPGSWKRLTAIARAAYPNTVSALSFTGTNGLFCASCHTPHGNFGQELVDSLGNPVTSQRGVYNMLSSKPNHEILPVSINVWANQGGEWCLVCHTQRRAEAQNPFTGVIYHNHPESACLYCHGNYVGSKLALQAYNTSLLSDFPHTGNVANILSNEPDALCITCHAPGTLP